MKTFRKIAVIISLIFVIVFVFFAILLYSVDGDLFAIGNNKFFFAPSYSKVDRFLKENFGELTFIADELIKTEYDFIRINDLSYDGYVMRVAREDGVFETIPLPTELRQTIEALSAKGVLSISISNGHSINIAIWSTMYESRGLIYVVDGTKPNGEQLIEVSLLSKVNWYYYVHNYEKAKELYPEKFE